ncbi:MAG: hypothetical protein ACRC2R_09725 [Xenococcaceae cyanobacterium]
MSIAPRIERAIALVIEPPKSIAIASSVFFHFFSINVCLSINNFCYRLIQDLSNQ